MKRILCLAFALVAPFMSASGAERYRVKLLLHPGVDGGAVAKRLAAAYQGEMQTPVDSEGTFVIAVSSAAATLLARDPQVAALGTPEVAPDAATSWSLGTFEYDHAGNIKQIGTREYVYDRESRLSYETIGTQKQQQLTYDGFGNIRTISEGSKVQTVGARRATNRADVTSTVPNYIYGTYDGAGNMLSIVTTTETPTPRTYTYNYDALNVMTKSTTDASRAYVYNANDERIGILTLTSPNGSEVSSQWTIRDPAGQVLRRFSRHGGQWRWMQDYIYRDGKMLASESNDQFKTLHYHLDHLGTPRLITGNGGVEVARHTYYPFGDEVPGAQPAVAEPKKFTGHERDSGGVDYVHARYYDFSMGRFLSIDPVISKAAMRTPQIWNRYSYVSNNPTLFVDPDGRRLQLSGCRQDVNSAACKSEAALFLSTFGKQSAEAGKYLQVGKNGFVTFKGITGQAFAAKFGIMGRAANYLISNLTATFTMTTTRNSLTDQGKGGYANVYNGPGGGSFGIDPSRFPTKNGFFGMTQTAQGALVHEFGHAVASLIPGFAANAQWRLGKSWGLRESKTYEGYALAFENAWRHEVLGADSNDIRSGYYTAGDIYDSDSSDIYP